MHTVAPSLKVPHNKLPDTTRKLLSDYLEMHIRVSPDSAYAHFAHPPEMNTQALLLEVR